MSSPMSMALIPYTPSQTPIEFIRSEVERGLKSGTIKPEQLAPKLSISSSPPDCPVCFEELSSRQMVYTQCCFQQVCEACDQIYDRCVRCRADLGDVRIQFGSHPMFTKDSSKLRLLPGKNTVDSVILSVKTFFPLVETQLTNRLTMLKLSMGGNWGSIYDRDSEITSIGQYYLRAMRLPHRSLSDNEVDNWIITLLTSGTHLTKNKLTKEEFHRKCSTYAMRIYPFVISQGYINSRLKSLEEQCYCKLDEKESVYRYIP